MKLLDYFYNMKPLNLAHLAQYNTLRKENITFVNRKVFFEE